VSIKVGACGGEGAVINGVEDAGCMSGAGEDGVSVEEADGVKSAGKEAAGAGSI